MFAPVCLTGCSDILLCRCDELRLWNLMTVLLTCSADSISCVEEYHQSHSKSVVKHPVEGQDFAECLELFLSGEI